MEHRSGKNKRGNSSYISTNENFEAEKESFLTIKKTHNGAAYTFQILKGDFREISFQNNSAIIKSTDGRNLNIDLNQLTPNNTYLINIKESKIQQVSMQQKSKPQPSTKPPSDTDPLDHIFAEEQLLNEFQKMFKQHIISSSLYKNLKSAQEKKVLRINLRKAYNKRVLQTKRLEQSYNTFFSDFLSILRNIDELVEIHKITQQENLSNQEKIDLLKTAKIDLIELQKQKEIEELEQSLSQDNGMSM